MIFVCAAALFLATSGGRLYVNDAYVKMLTARAIVDRGSPAIPSQGQLTVVSPKTGYSYAKFGLLHSLLFIPASVAAKGLVAVGVLPPERRPAAEDTFASLLSPICAALAAGLLYLFTCELFGSPRSGIALAALLALGTMIWPYAKRSWTEMPQTTLLLLAAWLLASMRDRPGGMRPLFAGFAFGSVVALRITGIVLLPLFLLFPAIRPGKSTGPLRTAVLFLAGTLVAVIPLVAVPNAVRFGSVTGLYRWRTGGFTTPFLEGFLGLLVSPGESVFLYSPVLIAALFTAAALWRRDRGAFLFAFGIPAALVLLYSSWWFHAYTWGPRFLIPAVPFLLLPLALLAVPKRRTGRLLLGTLIVLSVAVQVLGVSFHLGDLPRLAKPLIDAGFLPPDGVLTRDDTWHNPLRTRLVSHLLTLKESIPLLLSGKGSEIPFDFWPATVRERFGVSRKTTMLMEGALLAVFFLSAEKLRRRFVQRAGGSGVSSV